MLRLVEELDDGLDTVKDPPAEVRKLRRYLGERNGYAERHRYGEAVSTALIEATVNQVIAKRVA